MCRVLAREVPVESAAPRRQAGPEYRPHCPPGRCALPPVPPPWSSRAPRQSLDVPEGAVHGADVRYFFDRYLNPLRLPDPQEQLAATLIDHRTRFARTGAPGHDRPAYADDQQAMSLSARRIHEVDLADTHRCAFWNELGRPADPREGRSGGLDLAPQQADQAEGERDQHPEAAGHGHVCPVVTLQGVTGEDRADRRVEVEPGCGAFERPDQ